MPGIFSVGIFSCVLSFASFESAAQTPEQIETLANDPEWLQLLMYSSTWFRGQVSLVDDAKFFVSPEGKSDPVAEMRAVIAAIRDEAPADLHVTCRFPSRVHWLSQKLGKEIVNPELRNCPGLTKWLKQRSYSDISVVFSSYYVGNPSSLFGHTFLRLHSVDERGRDKPDHLDDVINFAANPTTFSAIGYTLGGLFGRFKGTFSLMPYYLKIQEYNNYESRDLWEYSLNLTDAEVERVLFSLWEVGPIHIDYYFLDDNCSLVILNLLAVARPQLADGFLLAVTPVDTLKAVLKEFAVKEPPRFRPSARYRFQSRYLDLSDPERTLLRDYFEVNDRKIFATEPDRKRMLLDAALEFIDYDEKLVGDREPKVWVSQRSELLSFRAALGGKSAPIEAAPVLESPERVHGSQRLTVAMRQVRRDNLDAVNEPAIGYRATFHSPDDPVAGLPNNMRLEAFGFELAGRKKEWRLREATLLGVSSMPDSVGWQSKIAWDFGIGLKNYTDCAQWQCADRNVFIGFGLPLKLVGKGALLGLADIGAAPDFGAYYGPGLALKYSVGQKLQLALDAGSSRRFHGKTAQHHHDVKVAVGAEVVKDLSLRLVGHSSDAISHIGVEVSCYF